MSDQPATETTPLLDPEVPSSGASNGPANRALAFRVATTTSLITSILTLIFLIASMALVSGAPPTYFPPYQIYFTFAPIAGFATIAGLHSGLVLLDGGPLRGTTVGMLVDVFGGLYFLFQSLYGMQQFFVYPRYGYTGCRPVYGTPPPSLDDCEKWRARVEPVVWTYLFVTLVLGLTHVILLFLRASTYKPGGRELRALLIGEDGNPIRR